MEWLWQFFYTLLPSKYPPMALSTLKTFLGGNSSDTLFFFLYLEIFGWEQFGYFVFFRYLEIFGWEQFGYFVFFLYLEIFGWEQFGYFVFFLYLEFFGWEQLKKHPVYCFQIEIE